MGNLNQQRGVGLIEVLVTLLILSTSLITLTAMQNRSLQFNQMSYFRSQANILAYDILDRMRLNAANINAYNVALAPFGNGGAAPASANIPATDLFEWRRDIDARLPNGQGGIQCNAATRICDVTITWDEINNSDANSTNSVNGQNESTSRFVYSVRI